MLNLQLKEVTLKRWLKSRPYNLFFSVFLLLSGKIMPTSAYKVIEAKTNYNIVILLIVLDGHT